MNVFAQRLLAATESRATFVVKNPDLLDVPSAADRKIWWDREDRDKLDWLVKISRISGSGVSMKIGNGQFKDKVEFNSLYKDPKSDIQIKVGKRRGYTLIEITLGG